MKIALAMLFLLGFVVAANAQSQQPSFEAASIKPNKEAQGMHSFEWPSPGTFRTEGVTVATLIRFAYDLKSHQIVGAPGWTTSERFDILAKANESVSSEIAKETTHSVRKIPCICFKDYWRTASN